MRSIHVALWVLWLGACATPEPEPSPAPAPVVAVKPPPDRIKSQPLKHLVGRIIKPIPDKELEVRAKCSFRDVQGGRGSMDLHVTKAEVKRLVAEVSIPRHGVCHFDLKNFEQTAKMPNVVLTEQSSGCIVRMWEQERGVTVAFNGCQTKCGGDAFSYLWPILVDPKTGRCS